MIAFIALTVLAIAVLPAWSPDLHAGTVIARFFNRTSDVLGEIGYANRRIRELQLAPVEPSTTDRPTIRPSTRS